MFIHSTFHGTITRETDSDVFVDIFKSIENKYEDSVNQMEESRFSSKLLSKLDIRCEKVNVPKSSSFIKSPDWLRYKNATRNPKNI